MAAITIEWLDQLKQASWRDVPFMVDSIDVTAGDNVVVREYPFQDQPAVFRMGRGMEEIKLSAYVIGNNYTAYRDELREALHNVPDEGGVLIHPTEGAIRCFVSSKYHVKENPTAEGGMARFDLTFVRAQAKQYPTGAANKGVAAKDAADRLAAIAKADFEAQFDNNGVSSAGQDAIKKRATSLIDLSWARTGVQGLRDALDASGAARAFATMKLTLNELINTPRALASEVAALFAEPINWLDTAAYSLRAGDINLLGAGQEFEMVGKRAQAWIDALKPVMNVGASLPAPSLLTQSIPENTNAGTLSMAMFGRGEAIPTSPSQARAELLVAHLDGLVEVLATAQAVRAAVELPLANIDQAFELRHLLDQQFNRLIERASTAAAPAFTPAGDAQTLSLFDALRAAHGAVLADLQARSVDLSRLTSYTPATWQPVIYISYRLFGTAAYADEIMAMNPHIRHPLLVPPNKPLRIIRHD